jgi:hypothetical protein
MTLGNHSAIIPKIGGDELLTATVDSGIGTILNND